MLCYLRLFVFIFSLSTLNALNVSISGRILFADGIGRHATSFIKMLKNDLPLNFVNCDHNFLYSDNLYKDIPLDIKPILLKPSKNYCDVLIHTEVLWVPYWNPCQYLPNSKIKFAFSVFEATRIPDEWVNILNKDFDGVIVADEWLIEVYKSSGVQIPIFALPLPLILDDFLNEKIRLRKNKIFKFGISAGSWHVKNHRLLIDAFIEEFDNNSQVELWVHTRGGDYVEEIHKYIKQHNKKNIKFIHKSLNQREYIHFLKNLDCFVLPSQGEGFSITPREAMALGIPCILSNNTAHKTICATGLVESVKSEIEIDAYYPVFARVVGKKFDCKKSDLRKALVNVYSNYEFYKEKALEGRNWVKQYLPNNVKKLYLNLLTPKEIIFSHEGKNEVTEARLITSDYKLYQKLRDFVTL